MLLEIARIHEKIERFTKLVAFLNPSFVWQINWKEKIEEEWKAKIEKKKESKMALLDC